MSAAVSYVQAHVLPGSTDCALTIRGHRAYITGRFPIRAVRNATSYYVEGFQFTKAYRNHVWDGKKHLFDAQKQALPAGLVDLVVEALRAYDPSGKIRVVDETLAHLPPIGNHGFELAGIEFGKGVFDYQLAAAKALVAGRRGVLKIATNGGKTECAIAVTKHLALPTLFMVDSISLLTQTRKRFATRLGLPEEDIGLIGDQKFSLGRWITVATPDSLRSRLELPEVKESLARWQVIWADECFPAGTPVRIPGGSKAIEAIQPGDQVESFIHSSGRRVQRRVKRVLRKLPYALVRVHFTNGRVVVCTPNHKFWTSQGWRRATELRCTDVVGSIDDSGEDVPVRALWGSNTRADYTTKLRAVLSVLPRDTSVSTNENSQVAVQDLSDTCVAAGASRTRTSTQGERLLLRCAQERVVGHALFYGNGKHKSQTRFGTDEATQSDASSHNTRQDGGHVEGSRPSTNPTSRKRAWPHGPGETASQCLGMANERHRSDQTVTRLWVPDALQVGCGRPEHEALCGDRWRESLQPESPGAGCEEGQFLAWSRVDGVEILQPSSDGTFGGVCADGLVYDLEVEDTHTYFVSGVAVSNCHHVAGEVFHTVMEAVPAYYRFGLSGTPLDRSDGSDLRLLAVTGPILYEVSNKLLVDRGISVPPQVDMMKVQQPVLPSKKLEWREVETRGVVENPHLNEAVAAKAIEHAKAGRQVLILVEKIKQARLIEGLIDGGSTATPEWGPVLNAARKHRLVTAYISGKDTGEVRDDVLERFRKQKVNIIIATTILDEGVDVPNIDVLILAAGGKGKIRLLQRVGRGLRTGVGKTRLLVIDFANFCHPWLLQHSLARLRTYKAEMCFMIRAA